MMFYMSCNFLGWRFKAAAAVLHDATLCDSLKHCWCRKTPQVWVANQQLALQSCTRQTHWGNIQSKLGLAVFAEGEDLYPWMSSAY